LELITTTGVSRCKGWLRNSSRKVSPSLPGMMISRKIRAALPPERYSREAEADG
jgi:hypothetical protein